MKNNEKNCILRVKIELFLRIDNVLELIVHLD